MNPEEHLKSWLKTLMVMSSRYFRPLSYHQSRTKFVLFLILTFWKKPKHLASWYKFTQPNMLTIFEVRIIDNKYSRLLHSNTTFHRSKAKAFQKRPWVLSNHTLPANLTSVSSMLETLSMKRKWILVSLDTPPRINRCWSKRRHAVSFVTDRTYPRKWWDA